MHVVAFGVRPACEIPDHYHRAIEKDKGEVFVVQRPYRDSRSRSGHHSGRLSAERRKNDRTPPPSTPSFTDGCATAFPVTTNAVAPTNAPPLAPVAVATPEGTTASPATPAAAPATAPVTAPAVNSICHDSPKSFQVSPAKRSSPTGNCCSASMTTRRCRKGCPVLSGSPLPTGTSPGGKSISRTRLLLSCLR